MAIQPFDINLQLLNRLTRLLCKAGNEIKEERNKEILNIKTIIRIKQKIKMLESKYKMLKEKNKNNIQLDNLNMHLNLIKNRLERIGI